MCFDLGQSLLCLFSVENESAFHRLLSEQQIDAEAAPRLCSLRGGFGAALLCGEALAGRAGGQEAGGLLWRRLRGADGGALQPPAPRLPAAEGVQLCSWSHTSQPHGRRGGGRRGERMAAAAWSARTPKPSWRL